MQSLELLGVVVLLGLTIALLWPWIMELRRQRPAFFVVAIVIGSAMLGAALSIVLVDDLLPDRFEPISRAALLVGIVGGCALLVLRDSA